jgi:CheY-like chemotaxis protein
MNDKRVIFLLVEDDDIHAHLVTRSLEKTPLKTGVFRVANGDDALLYLRQQGRYANHPRPDVVLLDLKLPKVDGHQVLAAIKADEDLRMIPVVVMTTSRDETDRAKAYQHHANSYVVKPADFEKFREVVTEVSHYWGVYNEPPCMAAHG